MGEFKLDTSGEIVLPYPHLHPHPRGYRWSDLDPFTQGYVEALFASLRARWCKRGHEPEGIHFLSRYVRCSKCGQRGIPSNGSRKAGRSRRITWLKRLGFFDLSPEALAMILRDCERFQQVSPPPMDSLGTVGGAWLWHFRQNGQFAAYRPLTITLADDGNVHLKEAAHG